MPARRPKTPDLYPLRLLTPAEQVTVKPFPTPVEVDLATRTSRTLWQWWDRDRGGWTVAFRLHPLLPLAKISLSADRSDDEDRYSTHYWNGRLWIVEDHPRACDMWGEKGEMGLGQGSPCFTTELDPGWMYLRTNRIALREGRDHVESFLLTAEGREYYADRLCADLINGSDDTLVGQYCHRKELLRLWSDTVGSDKEYKRERALAQTPYIADIYGEEPVVARLGEVAAALDYSAHQHGELLRAVRATPRAIAAPRVPNMVVTKQRVVMTALSVHVLDEDASSEDAEGN